MLQTYNILYIIFKYNLLVLSGRLGEVMMRRATNTAAPPWRQCEPGKYLSIHNTHSIYTTLVPTTMTTPYWLTQYSKLKTTAPSLIYYHIVYISSFYVCFVQLFFVSHRHKSKLMERFLQYFSRFKAHSDSVQLELNMHNATINRLRAALRGSAVGAIPWLQVCFC
jgi:hypothetical protein